MASKKPKPAKIMAPAHPFTASGAQTTTVWAKPTKKPKPATAGERLEMKRFGISLHDVRTRPVSKRVKAIDRAIARAVRKERERCVNIGKLWVASEVHDADMVRALANGDVL